MKVKVPRKLAQKYAKEKQDIQMAAAIFVKACKKRAGEGCCKHCPVNSFCGAPPFEFPTWER